MYWVSVTQLHPHTRTYTHTDIQTHKHSYTQRRGYQSRVMIEKPLQTSTRTRWFIRYWSWCAWTADKHVSKCTVTEKIYSNTRFLPCYCERVWTAFTKKGTMEIYILLILFSRYFVMIFKKNSVKKIQSLGLTIWYGPAVSEIKIIIIIIIIITKHCLHNQFKWGESEPIRFWDALYRFQQFLDLCFWPFVVGCCGVPTSVCVCMWWGEPICSCRVLQQLQSASRPLAHACTHT